MWIIEKRLCVTLLVIMVFVASLSMINSVSAMNTLESIEIESKTMTKQFYFVNKPNREKNLTFFRAYGNFSIMSGIVSKVCLKIEIFIPDKTRKTTNYSYSDALSIYLNGYITMRRGPFGILRNDAKNYNFFDNKTIFTNNTAYDGFFMTNKKYNNFQKETLKTGDNVEFEYSVEYFDDEQQWKFVFVIPCATSESDYGMFHQELYDIVLGENENFLTFVYWNTSETQNMYYLTEENIENTEEPSYIELIIPRLFVVETSFNTLFGLLILIVVLIVYKRKNKRLNKK